MNGIDLATLMGPAVPTTPASSTYGFGTVTSVSPLRVQLDTDSGPVASTPIPLCQCQTGDRVYCQITPQRQLIIEGIVGGRVPSQRYPVTPLTSGFWTDLGNATWGAMEVNVTADGLCQMYGVLKYGSTFTATANTEYKVASVPPQATPGTGRGIIWLAWGSNGPASLRVKDDGWVYVLWLVSTSLTTATTISLAGGPYYRI